MVIKRTDEILEEIRPKYISGMLLRRENCGLKLNEEFRKGLGHWADTHLADS